MEGYCLRVFGVVCKSIRISKWKFFLGFFGGGFFFDSFWYVLYNWKEAFYGRIQKRRMELKERFSGM